MRGLYYLHYLCRRLLVEIQSLVWLEQNASILDYQFYLRRSLFPRKYIMIAFQYAKRLPSWALKIRQSFVNKYRLEEHFSSLSMIPML